MSEVEASREYQFTFNKQNQSIIMATTLTRILKETKSPEVCQIEIQTNRKYSSRITVEIIGVDGIAVHEADKNSMTRIIGYFRQHAIKHKVGDLQVSVESTADVMP